MPMPSFVKSISANKEFWAFGILRGENLVSCLLSAANLFLPRRRLSVAMRATADLGSGPVQSTQTNSPIPNNSEVCVGTKVCRQQLSQLHQLSLFEQLGPNQPKMDDFLEQMFSLPTWASWDFNGEGSMNTGSINSGSGLPGAQNLCTMSLMPSGAVGCSSGTGSVIPQAREMQRDVYHPHAKDSMQYSFEGKLTVNHLQYQRGFHDIFVGPAGSVLAGQPQIETTPIPHQRVPDVDQNTMMALQLDSFNSMATNASDSQVSPAMAGSSRGAVGTIRSPSAGSSGSEDSSQQPPPQLPSALPAAAPTWHQQAYVAGGLPLFIGVGQSEPETFSQREVTWNDSHLLGKRQRDDDDDSLYTSFGGTQVGRAQTGRHAGQQSLQQVGQRASVPPYVSHTDLAQPNSATSVTAGAGKPRIRARRGQATDPHSIAERLRRERIAERMKALQELVPNSNKTDKASMLDEIIEYVKFVQLQVKVLSMSRMGGVGAISPLMTDIPAEDQNGLLSSMGWSAGLSGSSQDGMKTAECQVAYLMEEDMGSAMQYLQGKGLCMMPIALATAISSTDSMHQTNNQSRVKNLTPDEFPQIDVCSHNCSK